MSSSATTDEKLLKEMIQNAVHFGHKTSKWNPRMKRYIHGKHSGVHVFDLHQTAQALEAACTFMKGYVKEGKTILFVSTKAQSTEILKETAEAANMPYITHKWVPGLLTNFTTVKKRIQYLKDLKEQEKNGEFEKYTKKEALGLMKTCQKLEKALGGVQELTRRPDALFVLDVVRDKIAVEEAHKLGIPVVAIVDSNGDPSKITYPIPANDDAINAIKFLLGMIGKIIGKRTTTRKSEAKQAA